MATGLESTGGGGQDWDVRKLREELAKCKQTRAELEHRRSELEASVKETERMLQEAPMEGAEGVWHHRYREQCSLNHQLVKELHQLEASLTKLQEESDARAGSDYTGMSDASLRQLLRRLQKEHAEAQWQLRDCEWRLDQEGASVHRAAEERSSILTALEQATVELDKCRRQVSKSHEQLNMHTSQDK